MKNLKIFCLLMLLCINNSIVCGKMCDFSHVECLTKGSDHFYKSVIGGLVPITEENIEGELQTLHYKLTNVSLTGFENCDITKILIPGDSAYDFFLGCPQLILKSMYEAKGSLADTPIDSQGSLIITADDYMIRVHGVQETFTSDKDQKLHMIPKTFEIETDPKGKITIDTKRLVGDEEKGEIAKTFLNDNAIEMEKLFKNPAINKFILNFAHKYGESVGSHPIEEVLAEIM